MKFLFRIQLFIISSVLSISLLNAQSNACLKLIYYAPSFYNDRVIDQPYKKQYDYIISLKETNLKESTDHVLIRLSGLSGTEGYSVNKEFSYVSNISSETKEEFIMYKVSCSLNTLKPVTIDFLAPGSVTDVEIYVARDVDLEYESLGMVLNELEEDECLSKRYSFSDELNFPLLNNLNWIVDGEIVGNSNSIVVTKPQTLQLYFKSLGDPFPYFDEWGNRKSQYYVYEEELCYLNIPVTYPEEYINPPKLVNSSYVYLDSFCGMTLRYTFGFTRKPDCDIDYESARWGYYENGERVYASNTSAIYYSSSDGLYHLTQQANIGKYGSVNTFVEFDYSCENCEKSVRLEKAFYFPKPSMDLSVNYAGSYCTASFGYDYEYSPVAPNGYTGTSEDDFNIISQQWTFYDDATIINGNGTRISNEMAPIVQYSSEGVKRVHLKVQYSWPPCEVITVEEDFEVDFQIPETLAKTMNFSYHNAEYYDVLTSGAQEYQSAWPIMGLTEATYNMNPFASGMAGNWKSSKEWSYNTNRIYYNEVNTIQEGKYDLIIPMRDLFLGNPLEQWLVGSENLLFNPQGNIIEAKDILDRKSSTQYDPNGDFIEAVTVLSEAEEMAFCSFENLTEGKGVSGNFFFGSGKPGIQYLYPIISGYKNMVILDVPLEEFQSNIELGYIISEQNTQFVNVVCSAEEDEVSQAVGKTVVVVDQNISNQYYNGYWLTFDDGSISQSAAEVYTGVAHTGNACLKVTRNETFEQYNLKLEQGKEYFLSAWASKPMTEYPDESLLSSGIMIRVIFKRDGVTVQNSTINLVGPIIEGWQKLEGLFTVPEHDVVDIQFVSGGLGSAAFYDDVRLHPNESSMESYVYDDRYRVIATLDDQNYATLYGYAPDGSLKITRKETTRGIVTLQESINYLKGNN